MVITRKRNYFVSLLPFSRKCGKDVTRCEFNKDGSLLAVGLSDGAIKVSGDRVNDSTSGDRMEDFIFGYRANISTSGCVCRRR